MLKALSLFCFLFLCFQARTQVEVFGGDETPATADTVSQIDTVTAPVFGESDNDFLAYLEQHFNYNVLKSTLKPLGDQITFELMVDKSGEVTEFKVLQSLNVTLNVEIKKIVFSMPYWNPGTVNGKSKKVRMIYILRVIPINNAPYISVLKDSAQPNYTKSTNNVKIFLAAGALLILITLLITK
ncbi:MAG: hypothetical protein H7321_07140 [Bacteroidia bacterium]|nr:hypothetical protein [Bacteroidia bacterium]